MASCRDYFTAALDSDNPAQALDSICALDRGAGVSAMSERFGLPHHATPGGPPVRECVAAALQALGGSRTGEMMSGDGVAAARSHLEAHAKDLGVGEENREEVRPPIETREATVTGVNFPERVIDVVAVPYNQEAVVSYRSELWKESFAPGSFDGIEKRPGRIKANRDHVIGDLVGKALTWHPEHPEGLVGSIRIVPTPRGDETLVLADEGVLDVSVGFGVRNSDQVLDRVEHRRRINKAWLDHLSFVAAGAYAGAGVLAVRSQSSAADLPPLETPRLDEITAWMRSRGR